jgi:hypothetical protein
MWRRRRGRWMDELIEWEPPGPGMREPHNYFPEAGQAPKLAMVLSGSPAFGLAESLTGPRTLEVPWRAQVTLNILPFPDKAVQSGQHQPQGSGVSEH